MLPRLLLLLLNGVRADGSWHLTVLFLCFTHVAAWSVAQTQLSSGKAVCCGQISLHLTLERSNGRQGEQIMPYLHSKALILKFTEY